MFCAVPIYSTSRSTCWSSIIRQHLTPKTTPDPREPDGSTCFRRYGRSKDHGEDLPQIAIGPAVTLRCGRGAGPGTPTTRPSSPAPDRTKIAPIVGPGIKPARLPTNRGTRDNRWVASAEPRFLHQGLALKLVYPLVVADLPEHVRE